MTRDEKRWYTRGRVDQLQRRPFADLSLVRSAMSQMYVEGAESVTADEQDLYADTLAEIAEYEGYVAWHAFDIGGIGQDLTEARRRLQALEEPMPVLVRGEAVYA